MLSTKACLLNIMILGCLQIRKGYREKWKKTNYKLCVWDEVYWLWASFFRVIFIDNPLSVSLVFFSCSFNATVDGQTLPSVITCTISYLNGIVSMAISLVSLWAENLKKMGDGSSVGGSHGLNSMRLKCFVFSSTVSRGLLPWFVERDETCGSNAPHFSISYSDLSYILI